MSANRFLMMGIGTLRSQAQAPLTRQVMVPRASGAGTAPFSAGITVGNIIHVSGQTSGDAGPGIREQAQAALKKGQAIVEAGGSSGARSTSAPSSSRDRRFPGDERRLGALSSQRTLQFLQRFHRPSERDFRMDCGKLAHNGVSQNLVNGDPKPIEVPLAGRHRQGDLLDG